jgi:RHS repeat-associated protein
MRVRKRMTTQAKGVMRTVEAIYLPGLTLRVTSSGDGKAMTVTESLEEIGSSGAGNIRTRCLHWETGLPTSLTNDLVRYGVGDRLGSIGLELDATADLISREEYYPYGGTAVWTARSQIEADRKFERYSGKERDATGLYDYGYRYYQPWIGRWLNTDPAGTVDGLNLYRMVSNNPLTHFDQDGLLGEHEDRAALVRQRRAIIAKEKRQLNEAANVIKRSWRRFATETVQHDLDTMRAMIGSMGEPVKSADEFFDHLPLGSRVLLTANTDRDDPRRVHFTFYYHDRIHELSMAPDDYVMHPIKAKYPTWKRVDIEGEEKVVTFRAYIDSAGPHSNFASDKKSRVRGKLQHLVAKGAVFMLDEMYSKHFKLALEDEEDYFVGQPYSYGVHYNCLRFSVNLMKRMHHLAHTPPPSWWTRVVGRDRDAAVRH